MKVEKHKEGDYLRLKTRRDDWDSEEQAQEHAELTAHVVYQMRDLAGAQFKHMDRFAEQLDEHWGVEHHGGAEFDPEKDQ